MIWPLAFTVSGQPFAKGRPRTTARVVWQGIGRNKKPIAIVTVYTPPETRKAENRIRERAKQEMGASPPVGGPLRLKVRAIHEPPPSWPKYLREAAAKGLVVHTAKPDFDNLAKVIDAMNEVVWIDDAQITDALISKRYGFPARTEIIVERVDMTGKFLPAAQEAERRKRAKSHTRAPDVPAGDLFTSDLDALPRTT
jgi:Holliday junction resolvase RusA-like endonuclease